MDKEIHPIIRNDFDGWRDDGSEIDLVDIIDSLWRHKKMIAAVAAACIIGAFAYLMAAPRAYESRATLLFLPPIPSELNTDNRGAGMLTPDTYITLATAEDLLDDVITLAYSDVKIEERPTTDDIRRKMKVQLAKSAESSKEIPNQMTMTVSFRDKDPKKAMSTLNIWSNLFIKRNAQHFVDRAGSSFEFIGESVKTVKEDLEKTENSLLAYQRGSSIPMLKAQLQTTEKLYSEFLSKYNKDIAALPPLEAKAKAAEKLLLLEKETKSLSKGMSKEALWNFLSKNLSEAELKNLQELNIEDEFENEQYKYLKTIQADTKIEISALHASIKDLRVKTASLKKEHTLMYARLMEMETEVERLQREKTTLQDSYVDLSKKYQLSRITTVEATDPIKIVEKPILPRKPVSRGGLKILSLAGLLGLFMGITAALLAEMVSKKRASEA